MRWTQPLLRGVALFFAALSVFFLVIGTAILIGATSAVHEIETGVCWLISVTSVLVAVTAFGFASVLHALWEEVEVGADPAPQPRTEMRRRGHSANYYERHR